MTSKEKIIEILNYVQGSQINWTFMMGLKQDLEELIKIAQTEQSVIERLEILQKENPEQVFIVETPQGTVELKIGDALIYEDMHGKFVIDSE